MASTTYGKRLRGASWKEFRGFWSDYRLYLAILALISFPALASKVRHQGTIADLGAQALYGLAGLAIGMLGTYAIATFKGAESLDRQLNDGIAAGIATLRAQAEEVKALQLALARKHPHDEKKEAQIIEAMRGLSETQRNTFGWLLEAGEVPRGKLMIRGLDVDSLYNREDFPPLLAYRSFRPGNGLSEIDRYYFINPEMKEALRTVLYPAQQFSDSIIPRP